VPELLPRPDYVRKRDFVRAHLVDRTGPAERLPGLYFFGLRVVPAHEGGSDDQMKARRALETALVDLLDEWDRAQGRTP